MEEFEKELTMLINKYSIENGSDTPDFILARYLIKCLHAYEVTVGNRDEWFDEKYQLIGEDEKYKWYWKINY